MNTRDRAPSGRYASPPCLASEIDPTYCDPRVADPEQARDVARWRKAERARLRAARGALSGADRQRIDEALSVHLRELIGARAGATGARVVSGYWPIRGEADLRPLLTDLHDGGMSVTLPVVETQAAPLAFRRWTPEARLARGHFSIPVPAPDAEALIPDIVLAPLLGWDGEGYRLGYGGGYFDRTLAALAPRPFVIGVGLQSARLATIFPQPHDVPLDVILTEAGKQVVRDWP